MKSSTRLAHVADALRTSVQYLESGRSPKERDQVRDAPPPDRLHIHGYQITPEAAELAQEFDKLPPNQREVMAIAIMSMVAQHKRDKSDARKSSKKIPPTHQQPRA